jgi:hypothetical protein
MWVCLINLESINLCFFNQIAILFHKDSNALYETKPKGIFNELLARP